MNELSTTPVLDYERPLWSERLNLPKWVLRLLIIFALIMGLGSGAALLILKHLNIAPRTQWFFVGPSIGAIAIALACLLHGLTQVFSDRFEASVYCGPLRIWRKQIPWQQLQTVATVTEPGFGFRAIGYAQGATVIMYAGQGVQLKLIGDARLTVGSNDRQKLLDSIESARQASA